MANARRGAKAATAGGRMVVLGVGPAAAGRDAPPPSGVVAGRGPLRGLREGAGIAAAALVLGLLDAAAAWAGTGGSDLPWNKPLQTVTDNLTGPTAKTVAALAFVIGGAMWAFTSHEQGAKRFGQALFGVAIVLGAVNLVDALGFQGALF
jgi:type IV secretion system protein TrbC